MLKRPLFEDNIMLEREPSFINIKANVKTGFQPNGMSFDNIKPFPYQELPIDDYRHPKDLLRNDNPFSIENFNAPKKTFVKIPLTTKKNNRVNEIKNFNTSSSSGVLLSGLIVDETNQPFPNATISVIGNTVNGISTDFNGNYNLTVNKGDKVEVRFIGYKTLVFDWNKIPATIKMKEATNILDEVKLPDVKKKSNKLLYAGVGLGVLAVVALVSSGTNEDKGLNGTPGLTPKGKLKKGYRFKGGKVVKANQALKAVNVTL